MRELFATPPSEFVAARNELAKSLRREKRRDEATAIAALRRPGWDDWALNVAAAEDGDAVSSFAEAASAVREAQAAAIEGRDGPDVRAALRDLRERTARLVKVATTVLGRVGRHAGGGELNGRLSEVAGSASAVEQLRAGVLGVGDDAPGDVFAGLEPGEPRPRRQSKPSSPSSSPPAAAPERDRSAERAERRRRAEALRDATKARRDAAKVLSQADAALATATAAARRAQRERDAAAEALAAAEADVEQAQADVDAVDGT